MTSGKKKELGFGVWRLPISQPELLSPLTTETLELSLHNPWSSPSQAGCIPLNPDPLLPVEFPCRTVVPSVQQSGLVGFEAGL